jgi:hypothetical protein
MAAHDVRVEDVVAIHNRLKNHLVTAYNVPVDNYITRKDTPIINEGLVI